MGGKECLECGANRVPRRQSNLFCSIPARSMDASHCINLFSCFFLCFRQGFITNRESLYSLVEKYLPLEYREEIIPIVQAGNKILLK